MNLKSSVLSALWRKYSKNRVTKNAGWLIGGRIVQVALSFLVGLLTARYLGPSNYGLINYGAAYTAFFTAVCTLGINSVLVKEFVDGEVPDGVVLGTTLLLRVAAGLLSVATILCISLGLDRGEPVTIMVVALCSIGLLFNIFEVLNFWFQAQLQSKVTAVATLIGYSLTSGYRIFLMATQKPVQYFALATSVDYIAVAGVLLFSYFHFGGTRFGWSFGYAKKLLRKSIPFVFQGLMVAVYGQTDRLMLKHFYGKAETGYYTTAAILCTMWCFVLVAIIDSVSPTIMEAHRAHDAERFAKRNRQLYAVVFFLSAAAALVFCVGARWIILLLYGKDFLPAAAPLRILAWQVAFSYLGVARNAWMVCENKQRRFVTVYALTALVNVALNLMMIPRFGAIGAAVTALVTQCCGTVLVPLCFPSLRGNVCLIRDAVLLRKLR